jgi:phosphoserine phosphatase RsbU/P
VDRQDPYLRLHHLTIFVRDQDRSLRFYLDQLGFSLVVDYRFGEHGRFILVTPPDGTALLALVTPKPDSEEYKLIGQSRQAVFVTDDVTAKFDNWRERGVRFRHPPQTATWGGMSTSFEDLDGNSFVLVGWDEVSRQIEEQRRATAERLESERRALQELDIAKQVQAKLFPQTLPSLRTLEYAGICIQARQVGGDYYDFLDFGRERLGLVIGDIAGKGIAAALLMANLQANLRSQSAIAVDQPHRFLQSVNQLFFENTTDSVYATLFFAQYDDKMRRLQYANCGHLSALLLRHDNSLERLDSTCTVLGLLKEWDCSIEERRLFSGDTLALYTDGVTESFNDAGEEFGEQRLIHALRRGRELSPQALLTSIIDEVRQFSPHEQHDDITLVVAKGKGN